MPLMHQGGMPPAQDQYYHHPQAPTGAQGYDPNIAANQQGPNQPPQQINVSGLIRDVGGLEVDDNGSDPQGVNES